MKAKKKAIVVNAWQLDSRLAFKGWLVKPEFVNDAMEKETLKYDPEKKYWVIETLEGTMRAYDGDYLIEGIRGELYSCKKDIFDETYTIIERD